MISRSSVARGLAALAIPALLVACSSGSQATLAGTQAGSAYPAGCPTSQPPALGADDVRNVTIATDKGDIEIKVEGGLSPIATGNFVALASCGYYDGVVFHRIVPGFVIQGGDGQYGREPDVDPARLGSGGPPYRIQDEPITSTYKRGTVAMARTSEPNSAGSQFFIVLSEEGAAQLDSVYQVLGTVTSGMDAVDAIAAAADKESPTNPIAMTKVTVATP